MAGKGTSHHRIHGLTGIVMILTLPLAVYGLWAAVPNGVDGFKNWITAPLGAWPLLVFLTAALWYCKLEFDEVIMDYASGGLRSFALMANRVAALIAWGVAVYVIISPIFISPALGA